MDYNLKKAILALLFKIVQSIRTLSQQEPPGCKLNKGEKTMKNALRILSLLLVLCMFIGIFAACGKTEPVDTDGTEGTKPAESQTEPEKPVTYQDVDENDAVLRTDYTSVYDKIGTQVTIDMVTEKDDGTATVTVDGKTYTLGMDFLSMAMVYNTSVPAGSAKYKTEEDVYNEWWKLYIQRWNLLVPEVPLYSNQYFDLYNAKFEGFVTSPYWGAADAIIATTIKAGQDNSAILGNSTALSGLFRNSSWGKSSPAASDLDVQNLVTGYSTEMTDMSGAYGWNMKALAEVPVKTINEDGTLTYTIKVRNDMVFSDGSKITAKNYIAALLSNSTPVAQAAGGSGKSGLQVVGFADFSAATEPTEFAGVKLIDDYTFSVTYLADYAGYYYSMTMAGFSPNPLELYLGSKGAIVVNPTTKVCSLNADYYAKDGEGNYVTAAEIKANMAWNSPLPYSGPYVVQNYDESNEIATLKLNPLYPGDDQRGKASIETITYIKVISETQMDQFKNGEVDVIAGITGGDDTKAALQLVEENPTKYAETHYDRAGYGKLGFRCDYGPTMFQAVRQAIIYTINRPEFAQTFTGGYGSVVHGPYYKGYSAYKAVEDEISLNEYTYSSAQAIKALEAGGWTYNVKGQTFVAGKDDVRYKKLEGYELTKENITFTTVDGKYKTVKIDGAYYMPLAINYFGTQPNNVTDQLITAWQTNSVATTDIGMYIQYMSCEFIPGLYGELYHIEGYWDGVWKLNAINFATGFNSALYDFAFNWTINPDMYDDYSNDLLMDPADFWADYQ